jgi:hypothetical protein
MTAIDTDALAARIDAAYDAGGHTLGWRLLYSPARVLGGADVAFVTLHPVGKDRPPLHADFAMPSGSAYATESWEDHPAGEHPLQRQARALFARLDVPAEAVLAGNLVPFRAPDWPSVADREAALEVGRGLWRDILEAARPRLVIAMGPVPSDALAKVLSAAAAEPYVLGGDTATATRTAFDGGVLVGLPELDEHPVITRAESQPALRAVFAEAWPD